MILIVNTYYFFEQHLTVVFLLWWIIFLCGTDLILKYLDKLWLRVGTESFHCLTYPGVSWKYVLPFESTSTTIFICRMCVQHVHSSHQNSIFATWRINCNNIVYTLNTNAHQHHYFLQCCSVPCCTNYTFNFCDINLNKLLVQWESFTLMTKANPSMKIITPATKINFHLLNMFTACIKTPLGIMLPLFIPLYLSP